MPEKELDDQKNYSAAAGIRPINIALIGISEHAEEHIIPSIQLVPSLRLHTIASRNETKGRSAQSRYRFAQYEPSWSDAVESKEVEAVVVTGPPEFHYEVACKAIQENKHVFIEKPCAIDTRTLQDLIARSSAKPHLVTQVGYNFRHSDTFLHCYSIANLSGRRSLEIIDFHANKPRQALWTYESILESFLYGVGIHAIEMATWLIGDCQDITIDTQEVGPELVYICLSISNSEGRKVQVRTSNAYSSFNFAYEVFSETGSHVRGNSDHPGIVSVYEHRSRLSLGNETKYISSTFKTKSTDEDRRGLGYQRQFERFSSSIRESGIRTASVESSLTTYQLIDKIIENAKAKVSK